MSDEVGNPYVSPQGQSDGESSLVPSQNSKDLRPISKGMVEMILHGVFTGASCFAAAYLVMAACFGLLIALLYRAMGTPPEILSGVIECSTIGLILGTFFGLVSGALHGIVWYYFQDQPQRFSLLMVSGCLYSILVLEGPQVVFNLYIDFFYFGEFISLQAIAICFAAWRLNLSFYNKLLSEQLVEE